ncbi:MAG: hypothetical protein JO244_08055, partial [Solirubrobacterales bacterium]|nr:hypothetical protein [Solirubrobacterales bacterium]
ANVIRAEPLQGDLAGFAPPMPHPGMGVLALDVTEPGHPAAQIEQWRDGGSVAERRDL